MQRSDIVIIGAGQAGLALSRCLSARGLDHVVLERGRIGERWRSERWDSLRLLSPNWCTRLPGWRYQGDDPDGFMTMPEFTAFLDAYARSFAAPVVDDAPVVSVGRRAGAYEVVTGRGTWRAAAVVIATGHCDQPAMPSFAASLDARIAQIVPSDYRDPAMLPEGGVLVVGASSSGAQIADALARAGRRVLLAAGRHTRLPRRYRGRDIFWWFDRTGILDEAAADQPDIEAARRQPSMQLVGHPDYRSIDLGTLARRGVGLAGRALGADGTRIRFADDLAVTMASAEVRLTRLLDRFDRLAEAEALDVAAPGPRPEAIPVPATPAAIDLDRAGIGTVIWATGYRRDYRWLHLPVLEADGEIRQRGGITPLDGLYALGLRFMRRRSSSFIDGVGRDAEELAQAIAARFRRRMAA